MTRDLAMRAIAKHQNDRGPTGALAMLRIVTQQDGETWTLSLHGRVAESWVELLDRQWRSVLEAVPAGRVKVLLSDVSFIDGEGQRLLERMWRRGTSLEAASGCMNRYLIARIRARTATTEDVAAKDDQPRNTGENGRFRYGQGE